MLSCRSRPPAQPNTLPSASYCHNHSLPRINQAGSTHENYLAAACPPPPASLWPRAAAQSATASPCWQTPWPARTRSAPRPHAPGGPALNGTGMHSGISGLRSSGPAGGRKVMRLAAPPKHLPPQSPLHSLQAIKRKHSQQALPHPHCQHHVPCVAHILQVAFGVVQGIHAHWLGAALARRQPVCHRQQRSPVILALQDRDGGLIWELSLPVPRSDGMVLGRAAANKRAEDSWAASQLKLHAPIHSPPSLHPSTRPPAPCTTASRRGRRKSRPRPRVPLPHPRHTESRAAPAENTQKGSGGESDGQHAGASTAATLGLALPALHATCCSQPRNIQSSCRTWWPSGTVASVTTVG